MAARLELEEMRHGFGQHGARPHIQDLNSPGKEMKNRKDLMESIGRVFRTACGHQAGRV
ncbi:MAG: hypothetical protein M0T73_13855 [Deltaproteobacteria bacterium]|nr:hypothetical protein [Deltaproteobacteria bacterium]